MSTKRIIEDKDFHRIVIATRRGARNITMRVKPDGLYLTVPPYSKTDKVLSTWSSFVPIYGNAFGRWRYGQSISVFGLRPTVFVCHCLPVT